MSHWMLVGSWTATIVTWIVGALYNAWKSPPVRQRELPVSWILGSLLYLLIRYVMPASWLQALTWSADWMALTGMVVLGLSTVFTIYSRVALGTMWSSEPSARADHKLRTEGPYAVTRNPIYTGLLGMILGSALLCGLGPWLVAWIGVTAIFLYKISLEEKLMRQVFGAEFDTYVQRVPRLLPWPR